MGEVGGGDEGDDGGIEGDMAMVGGVDDGDDGKDGKSWCMEGDTAGKVVSTAGSDVDELVESVVVGDTADGGVVVIFAEDCRGVVGGVGDGDEGKEGRSIWGWEGEIRSVEVGTGRGSRAAGGRELVEVVEDNGDTEEVTRGVCIG